MVILIDDLQIPAEQERTVSIFFSLPIDEKSKMTATDKQKSSFRYIINNNEHNNTKSMSFFMFNPWERLEYRTSMKKNTDNIKLLTKWY